MENDGVVERQVDATLINFSWSRLWLRGKQGPKHRCSSVVKCLNFTGQGELYLLTFLLAHAKMLPFGAAAIAPHLSSHPNYSCFL